MPSLLKLCSILIIYTLFRRINKLGTEMTYDYEDSIHGDIPKHNLNKDTKVDKNNATHHLVPEQSMWKNIVIKKF